MLLLRVKKLLESKGIDKPYSWLRKHGFDHHSSKKLLSREHIRVPLRQLELLCKAAYCTPSDLMEWYPDHATDDIPHHPLQALRHTEPDLTLQDLYKLPPDKLKEIKEIVRKGV